MTPPAARAPLPGAYDLIDPRAMAIIRSLGYEGGLARIGTLADEVIRLANELFDARVASGEIPWPADLGAGRRPGEGGGG